MSLVKLVPAGSLLLAVALIPTAATAQVTDRDSAGRPPWDVDRGPADFGRGRTSEAAADTAFIRAAAGGDLLEVRLGSLARSRAADPAVKAFASRMATDHGSMREQWAALLRDNDLPAVSALGPAQEEAVTRLARLSGASFDRAYLADMIRNHERDVALFQRQSSSAQSSEVRRLAADALPTLREHLDLAREVSSRIGGSPAVAAEPRPGAATDAKRFPATGQATGNASATADRARSRRAGLGADRDFVQEVVADHVLQTRLARRALGEARRSETRQLARRMLEELGRWEERWTDLAARNGLRVGTGLGKHHQDKLDRLERASRGEVDRTYARIVADHLGSIVPYFEKEGRAARAGAVRRLVDEELPTIREQLARARRLERESESRSQAAARER